MGWPCASSSAGGARPGLHGLAAATQLAGLFSPIHGRHHAALISRFGERYARMSQKPCCPPNGASSLACVL
jgi:hypothetical protein